MTAPDPTLTPYTTQFVEYVQRTASPELQADILSATCSRGRRKGLVQRMPDARGQTAQKTGAWHALMLELCPSRCNIAALMGWPEAQAVFERVSDWATTHRRAVNQLAQAPFEFNLYHHSVEGLDVEIPPSQKFQ